MSERTSYECNQPPKEPLTLFFIIVILILLECKEVDRAGPGWIDPAHRFRWPTRLARTLHERPAMQHDHCHDMANLGWEMNM